MEDLAWGKSLEGERLKGVLARVEQKIEEFPIGSGIKKSVIWLFIRGEDRKRYIFKDPFFEPYCYFRRGILNINSFQKEIKSHRIVHRDGNSYLQVFTYFPTEVSKLRNIIESRNPKAVSVFEADVLFPMRYIIDKKIRGAVEWDPADPYLKPLEEDLPSNLRVFFLDIEMLPGKIICLTIWDNYDQKYFTWYWRENPVTVVPEDDWIIDWSTTEEEMLRKVLIWIKERNPDVIAGYNIDWDLMGLRGRVLDLQLGNEWDDICPMQGKRKEERYHMPPPRERKKKFRDFWVTSKHQRIPGRNIVDLLEVLLKMEEHHLSEFNLEYVAQNYLKPPMEKLKWNGQPMGKIIHLVWPKEPLAVLKYNKNDVRLCVELNKQQALLSFTDELRKFVGCQIDDIFSNKRIAHIELLRHTKKPLPVTKKETRGYKGAIVVEPKKGVYKWIIVMDFRSLYPSVILQLNIDPDTYIPISRRRLYNITSAYILKDKDSNTEYWFKKAKQGDLPAILRNYLAKREEKREEMERAKSQGKKELAEILDAQQKALKAITNAFYGSLLYRGTPSAWMCARAITCGAREAIRFAMKVIEDLGFKVIYGDSVLGNTPVVIRKDGLVDILPIEDLYPILEDGRMKIQGIEVLTENEWSPLQYVYRHKTTKAQYILNSYGGRIDCTKDHSLIVKGREVKPLETKEVEYVYFLIPSKITLDIEQAWLLGFFAAEGSLSKRYKNSYVINIANQNRNLLTKCQRILSSIGIKSVIYETTDSSNCLKLNILRPQENLNFFGTCLSKKGDKKVPISILNSSKRVKESFLQGYLAGDGSEKNKEGIVEFGSIDQSLVAGLIQILNEQGKKYTVSIRKDKPKWTRVRINKNPQDKRIKRKELIREVIEKESGIVYDLGTKNHHFVGGIGNVLLHNTDSIMVESKFDNYRKVVEEAEYLSNRVTQEMPKFLATFGGQGKSYINLALDKIFRTFLIAEKKKQYAGIPVTKFGEEKMEVKGFGTVRSDTSKFAGSLQKTLLKEILEGKERERIKLLTELELAEFDRKSLTEIGVPCVLTKNPSSYKKNPIQKKAFHFSNKYLGTDFKVGDKPKRLYVEMLEKKIPLEVVEKVDVIVFEGEDLKLPKWLKLDYPKMLEKTVRPKLEKALSFIEIEWKDLKLKPSLQKPKKVKKKKKKAKGKKTLV